MNYFLIFVLIVGCGFHMIIARKGENCELTLAAKIRTEEQQAQQVQQERRVAQSTARTSTLRCSYSSIRVLRELTQDTDEQTRLAALELLWRMQDVQSPLAIRKMLESETNISVKTSMIDILAKDKSRLSLSLIALALKDYDTNVRLKAVSAISSFICNEAIEALAPAARDEEAGVRRNAEEAAKLIRQEINTGKAQALDTTGLSPIYTIE